MWYVGVDGCHRGWLAVALKKGSPPRVDLFVNMAELWDKWGNKASLILIDIPIGLPRTGKEKRECDVQARKIIGKRRSSVFPVPCRNAVRASSKEDAIEANYPKGIPPYSEGIRPKIKEVDIFLANERNKLARSKLRETHPEVCFRLLNPKNSDLTHNKKEDEGSRERVDILRKYFSQPTKLIDKVIRTCGSPVEVHDVLDALVAAVTASKQKGRPYTLPSSFMTDDEGLPMAMVVPPSI